MPFHWFQATAVGVAIAAAGSSSLAAQADSGIVLGPRLSLATVIAQTIRHSPAWVMAVLKPEQSWRVEGR